MKLLFDTVDSEKLMPLCIQSKTFLENYQTLNSMMQENTVGYYYTFNIETEMTFLTEYISQVLDRKELPLVRSTLTDIVN